MLSNASFSAAMSKAPACFLWRSCSVLFASDAGVVGVALGGVDACVVLIVLTGAGVRRAEEVACEDFVVSGLEAESWDAK